MGAADILGTSTVFGRQV